MDSWQELMARLRALAKSEGITVSPDVLEEVAKVMVGLGPLDDGDFNRAGIILLRLVEKASDGRPKEALAVGSAIRMIIRGMTIRVIVDMLGIDQDLVEGLLKKVYDFIVR